LHTSARAQFSKNQAIDQAASSRDTHVIRLLGYPGYPVSRYFPRRHLRDGIRTPVRLPDPAIPAGFADGTSAMQRAFWAASLPLQLSVNDAPATTP
jgi:hypothetical protein